LFADTANWKTAEIFEQVEHSNIQWAVVCFSGSNATDVSHHGLEADGPRSTFYYCCSH